MNKRNKKLLETLYVSELADLLEGSFRVLIKREKEICTYWDSEDLQEHRLILVKGYDDFSKFVVYDNNGHFAFGFDSLKQAKKELKDFKEMVDSLGW